MVRAENKEVFIYGRDKKYLSRKKLYEPAFNAMMYLVMKNGCKDYITRTYLMEFKKYLGI